MMVKPTSVSRGLDRVLVDVVTEKKTNYELCQLQFHVMLRFASTGSKELSSVPQFALVTKHCDSGLKHPRGGGGGGGHCFFATDLPRYS